LHSNEQTADADYPGDLSADISITIQYKQQSRV